ncbi:lamin-like protein [Biomphalaria glabrata]
MPYCRREHNFDLHSNSAEHSDEAKITVLNTNNCSSRDDNSDDSYEKLFNKLDSKHSREIEDLKLKSLEQVKKFEYELQKASKFMSSLESQLSELVVKNNEQINEVLSITETLRDLPQEVADQKERLESFLRAEDAEDKFDEVMKQQRDTQRKMNRKYACLSKLVKDNETELTHLQTFISSDTMTDIKQRLTDQDKYLKRMEGKQKEIDEKYRKRCEDMDAQIQANYDELASSLHGHFKSLQSKVSKEISDTKLLIDSLETRNSEITEQLSNYKSHNQELNEVKTKMISLESENLKLSKDVAALLKRSLRDAWPACRMQIDNSDKLSFKKGTILTCFNSCLLNIGNCYNRSTGIFKAPCKGLYLCSLMLESDNRMATQFIIYERKGGNEAVKGSTHTNSHQSIACIVTVLELNQADEVYIKSLNDIERIKFNRFSYFLCVLLQQM